MQNYNNYNGNNYNYGNTGSGTVSLSLSPNVSTLANGQTTRATANAYDPDGIASVSIYLNGVLSQICSANNSTNATCSMTVYGNSSSGSSVSVSAQATDRFGNVAYSSTDNIAVTR